MSFKSMSEGSKEDWQDIEAAHGPYQAQCPERIIAMLKQLEGVSNNFAVNQLEHSLQTATRALRDKATEEMVLCALCHDIGKCVGVPNHGQIAAEILKPYVSDAHYQLIKHHQDFQGKHYYEHFDKDPDARQKFKNEPWFALAEQFADDWDQQAFDPDYDSLPLSHFEPLINKFFSSTRNYD